jgi:hypothetical protein
MKTLACPRDQAELLRRIRNVGPESHRRWGKMTVHQMVCHLTDCFRMTTGDKAVADASSLHQRTIVKWIALYAPLRWPTGLDTRPEVDQQSGGTAPADFASDLADLEAQIELVSALGREFTWPRHPIFGRMSRAAWLRWGYLHVDHHLRQFGA